MPALLDLFCGAGGAAMGYHQAGFDRVVGVDIEPKPNYPFEFHKADALDFLSSMGYLFDAVHASPPCQLFSIASIQDGFGRKRGVVPHVDFLTPTRKLLVDLEIKKWVIENVPGAPLVADLVLCGKMFNLDVARHRVFELSGFTCPQPEHREHSGRVIGVYGHTGGSSSRDGTARRGTLAERRLAMGIDWMKNTELVEAVPPAYTSYIGKYLIRSIRNVHVRRS